MFIEAALMILAGPTLYSPWKRWCAEFRRAPDKSRPSMLAKLDETDGDGKTGRQLTLTAQDYKLILDFGPRGGNRRPRLSSLHLKDWAPPAGLAFPLTVDTYIGGRHVGTQRFAKPMGILVSPPVIDGEVAEDVPLSRWVHRPAIDFAPITLDDIALQRPDLHLTVVDRFGALVVTRHLSALDLADIAVFGNAAFPRLERRRRLDQCAWSRTVTAID